MNPDSGKIHELDELDRIMGEGCDERPAARPVMPFLRKKAAPALRELEHMMDRAKARISATRADFEPPPGTTVPPDWPRFSVGDEVPYKGWFFRIEYVDVKSQCIVLKPHRPTKSTAERRTRKRRRKKKRGRG